ncbi:cytoplasmic tRNA 2-thiolation protein 2 isoform X2 [Lampris incognitus]|uniref:cytoplasmic tRNA 2-thiolation protein 2 isoform X2 n=1 Tax=Lampris incognitus TaxID=2546036 RepID=UPI0024B4EAA1|nr:cytoplasmic tRNA 2-thiolation protein 2 isoform X2 [Lampris incognitus]
MCQVDEEYNGLLERQDPPGVSKKCVKCKEATGALVIRAGDTFCRGCFKEYFVHKFRAMLGKNRIIFPGEKVLLAVSGGPSSFSMLGQVQEGLSQNAHKKLRFTPGIVHIDEGGILGQAMETRQRTVTELQSVFKTTGLPYHIVPLEQVLTLPISVLEPSSSASDQPADSYKNAVDSFILTSLSRCLGPEQQADLSEHTGQGDESPLASLLVDQYHTDTLQKLFSSVKTQTAKEDLLHILRQHLLVHIARREGYSKVMLGENCTRLAVKLLANISLGRGAQLAVDTGFSDPRYGDITMVRPMRDYSAEEISLYNHMCNVPSVFMPSLDTKVPEKASIQHLTESFVTNLQADFPSTVSTIYRTSEKLQTVRPSQNSSGMSTCNKCLFCMCTLDTTVEESSAFQAILISEQLSQRKAVGPEKTTGTATQSPGSTAAPANQEHCCSFGGQQGGGEVCGGAGGGRGCCSSFKAPDVTELKSLLCYSCQLTVKDMSSIEVLPKYILSEAQKKKRRSQMRDEISEFLLDDDED